MKRKILTTTLILSICLTSFARKLVSEGKTYTSFGGYKIEVADNPFSLKGKELKTFIISYKNTKMEVTIAMEKSRRGMTYYVLSPELSLKYVCSNGYFGVAMLGNELEVEGYKTSASALNRSQYFYQKVIAQGSNCNLEHSKLIAAYFPMLINNSENLISEKISQ